MLLDPFRSLADFSFYRTLPRKSGLAAVGYLAYVGLLFSAVALLALHLRFVPHIDEGVQWASKNVPVLRISGGKVESDVPGPVRVEHPKIPQISFLIDTARTTPVTAYDLQASTVTAYVTQNAIYVHTGERLEAYDIGRSKLGNQTLVIDGNFYRQAAEAFKKVLYPVAFLFTWLVFFLWKHLSALFYSIVALVFNLAFSAGQEFGTLYKVGVYAQTPVIALQAAQLFLPSPVPFFGLIALAVACVYVAVAVRQLRPEAPASEQPAQDS
jgi:hypothetical protein